MTRKKASSPALTSPYSALAAALARRRAEVLSPARQHEIAMMGVRARAKKRRERDRSAGK